MSQQSPVTEAQMKSNMDAMYRWTRHIYDASRKYYLLGRDKLIQRLQISDDDLLCEVGCGTARNLRKIARRYPDAVVYGIDASDEMLKTARETMKKYGVASRVNLAQGFAQSFSAQEQFGLDKPFNKFVFSYSLSIIPPWKESLDHTLDILPDGGELHIVDFGSCGGQPKWFRTLIFWWLKMFHVYYKPEIEAYLKELEASGKGTLEIEHPYGGYCYLAKFKKSSI